MVRKPLPTARLVSNEPSAAAVRWVYRATWLALILFALLVVIGYVPKS